MDLQVLLAMGAKEKKNPHHKFTTPLKWWWCTYIYSYTFSSHVVEHMKEIFFHQH
jgi:HD superfamily phosphodiesterase